MPIKVRKKLYFMKEFKGIRNYVCMYVCVVLKVGGNAMDFSHEGLSASFCVR